MDGLVFPLAHVGVPGMCRPAHALGGPPSGRTG